MGIHSKIVPVTINQALPNSCLKLQAEVFGLTVSDNNRDLVTSLADHVKSSGLAEALYLKVVCIWKSILYLVRYR